MPIATILFGLALIAEGGYFYFGSASEDPSPTALIPAFVGLPLVICGALALKEKYLKHAMHAAAMLGLLGFLGAAGRFVPGLIKNGTIEGDPMKATGIMSLLCAVFVGLCVNSFIQVRRRQKSQQQD